VTSYYENAVALTVSVDARRQEIESPEAAKRRLLRQHPTELLERLSTSLSAGLDHDRFDVVVSDVRMPGWSGLNVLITMSHQVKPPPIVLITAFGDERLHEQAMKAGAIAVLDKPFELDDLCALVNRLMEP
jgi:FixJ family two-component response regulator